MAKTSQEIEQEFIDGIKSATGKELKAWLEIIKKKDIEKRNDIINWLKKEQAFGHVNASLLVGIYLNNGKAVYADAGDLLSAQFEKKEQLKSLYDELIRSIKKIDSEIQVTAKKTYISLHKQKEFAAINVKSTELRLGMDLGDLAFNDYLQKSKITGPMPRISHMVIITEPVNINKKLLDLMKKANERVNGS
jgi:predicted transport protein